MAKIGPRDNQKSALYRGEQTAFEQFFEIGASDLKEAQATVMFLWRRADVPEGVPAPTMVENTRLKTSVRYTHTDKHIISTNVDTVSGKGMSVATLAHETAHAVLNANGLSQITESHGPEFCHIYAKFIAALGGENMDFATAARLLRAEGLRVNAELEFSDWSGDYYVWEWTATPADVRFFTKGKRAMEQQIRNSKFETEFFDVCKIQPTDFFN